jgi:hypothetical protein
MTDSRERRSRHRLIALRQPPTFTLKNSWLVWSSSMRLRNTTSNVAAALTRALSLDKERSEMDGMRPLGSLSSAVL